MVQPCCHNRRVNCCCKLVSGKRAAALPPRLRPRFLSGLTKTELEDILSAATHRQFLSSSVIIHEEDPAERLFLLTSGRGRHFVLKRDGRKILLHWLTAGQIFGGATILSTPSYYLASTELLSDGCALVWDKKTIRQFVSRFPRLLDNALSIAVTEHIAWMVATNSSQSSDDARGRIAHILVSLASAIGEAGPHGIEIQVGNEDLAAAANVTAFTVSRVLSAWQSVGVLKKARGKLVLLRPERLILSG